MLFHAIQAYNFHFQLISPCIMRIVVRVQIEEYFTKVNVIKRDGNPVKFRNRNAKHNFSESIVLIYNLKHFILFTLDLIYIEVE